MKKQNTLTILLWLCTAGMAWSQEKPHLHVNTRWDECSFQLDSSLTQDAWHRFTAEAGLASYFRPLTDARPLGRGNTDISVMQWKTKIDAGSEAWNNTFVHPDTAHWLTEGPRLAIPGLCLRMGITDKLDAGVFWTTNPLANYSITGAMLQYNFINNTEKNWSAGSRISFSTIYGPEDIRFSTYGTDVLLSRRIKLSKDWLSVSPYVLGSAMLSHSRERSKLVSLNNENVLGLQAAVGLVLNMSFVRLGVEYNSSKTNTLSFKLGAQFRLWK